MSEGRRRLEIAMNMDGLVEWNVPASLEDGEVNVIITLRDAIGQQIFHNLKLEKSDPLSGTAPDDSGNPAVPE